MMTLASAGGADETKAPIYLIAEPTAGGVRVQVVGASDQPYDATFSLEVDGGGNVSRHRGSASLAGGAPVTLSTVTIGVRPPNGWQARLSVEPRHGEAYGQVRSSS